MRPGLRLHPKYKRLIALLKMPEAHVLGHLTLLWESSYELGEDLGDSLDVEITSGWVGEPGVLCTALLNCGGSDRSGFIEPIPDRPGQFRVRDFCTTMLPSMSSAGWSGSLPGFRKARPFPICAGRLQMKCICIKKPSKREQTKITCSHVHKKTCKWLQMALLPHPHPHPHPHRYYPLSPRGECKVEVFPPKGKADGTFERLFADRPDALPHFQAILHSHSKKRAILVERKKKGLYKKCGIPSLDPTPGAIAFLLLVNGGNDPLLLRAMHHCYLINSSQVEDGFMQTLKVFFGAPGKSKKCTWEGFRDDAVAFLADLKEKSSQAIPPPPAPAPALPLVSADLLANAGFALPLPL